MARSMLSPGTDASRAFCTAEASVMFPSTFPPPSRAATSMARSSFEYIRARFSSVADFFLLMEAHLECPDTALSHQLEDPGMEPGIACHLRVERRGQQIRLPHHDRESGVLREDFDAIAHPGHPRRADEDAAHGTHALHIEVRLERVHLAPVRVAFDRDVHQRQQ